MSSATHCDGPSCSEWTLESSSVAGYIVVQKKYTYMHFCSWSCAHEWMSGIDILLGPENMRS